MNIGRKYGYSDMSPELPQIKKLIIKDHLLPCHAPCSEQARSNIKGVIQNL